MSTTRAGQTVGMVASGAPPAPRTTTRRLRLSRDALVLVGYLVAAVIVTSQLWARPGQRVAPLYQGDPAQVEWFLAHAAHALTDPDNPFFTGLMNVPDGVNLMANTSILGLAIPIAPVTLLFGPHVSFLVLVTIGLAGTASAWYLVLSRQLISSRLAAAVGGWFCGFAPAMISHANWHPNIISQFLVPVIVWRVLCLREPGRALRNGSIVGLLVTYQAFINEEILLFTALASAVFLIAFVLQRRDAVRWWRPMLAGTRVAIAVAGVLLAYPLWAQFFGPYHYRGLHPAGQDYVVDLAAFAAFSTESLLGDAHWSQPSPLAPNYAEENAFFGWPLLAMLVPTVWLVRRDVAARAVAITALVFSLLSLGPEVIASGERTGIPGPWAAVRRLPIVDSVIPARFGLVVTAAIGVLLALATQRILDLDTPRRATAWTRVAWGAGIVIALVAVAPTPLAAVGQPPVPRFIAQGHWRAYVNPGQTIVPVPIPSPELAVGLRWAAATDLEFAIPRGYFLFPEQGDPARRGVQGAPPRPTSSLLQDVALTGRIPRIADAERVAAEVDLRYWRAAIVVLPVADARAGALRATLNQLLGPPQRLDDVWLWDVRALLDR